MPSSDTMAPQPLTGITVDIPLCRTRHDAGAEVVVYRVDTFVDGQKLGETWKRYSEFVTLNKQLAAAREPLLNLPPKRRLFVDVDVNKRRVLLKAALQSSMQGLGSFSEVPRPLATFLGATLEGQSFYTATMSRIQSQDLLSPKRKGHSNAAREPTTPLPQQGTTQALELPKEASLPKGLSAADRLTQADAALKSAIASADETLMNQEDQSQLTMLAFALLLAAVSLYMSCWQSSSAIILGACSGLWVYICASQKDISRRAAAMKVVKQKAVELSTVLSSMQHIAGSVTRSFTLTYASPHDEANSVTLIVNGSLGMKLREDNGVVKGVDKDGQAEKLGVREGWQVTSIDGEPYSGRNSFKLILEKAGSQKEFKITFAKEAAQRQLRRQRSTDSSEESTSTGESSVGPPSSMCSRSSRAPSSICSSLAAAAPEPSSAGLKVIADRGHNTLIRHLDAEINAYGSPWEVSKSPLINKNQRIWSSKVPGQSRKVWKSIFTFKSSFSLEQLVDHLMIWDQRLKWDKSFSHGETLRSFEGVGDVSRQYTKQILTVSPREFVDLMSYRVSTDGRSFVFFFTSLTQDDMPGLPATSKGMVRGESISGSGVRYSLLSSEELGDGSIENLWQIEVIAEADPKGWIPVSVINSAFTMTLGENYTNITKYFGKH